MARDTKIQAPLSFQSWTGTDSRTEPCLVPENKFSFAENILFGLQGCAERITGKKVTANYTYPIVNIFPLSNTLICIQTLSNLLVIPVTDIQ